MKYNNIMNTISFLPFQNLESERLLLRQITDDDVNEVFEMRSNPDVMKFVPRPLVTTKEEALAHIKLIQNKIEENEGINWAITLKGNPKLLGIIGHYKISWENLRSEIGYMLLPEYQGMGIISEAVKLLIDYGFNTMKMHSLEAVIDPRNQASAKVLEKNNFVLEAQFKEDTLWQGEWFDTNIYSLLNKN